MEVTRKTRKKSPKLAQNEPHHVAPMDLCLVVDAKTPDITPLIESLYRQENIDLSQYVLYLHVRGKKDVMQEVVNEIQEDYAPYFLGIAVTYVPSHLSETAAINRQIADCSQDYALLLDAQTYLEPHCLWQLHLAASHSPNDVMLLQAANSAQAFELLYNPLNLRLPYSTPGCLMIRRNAFKEVLGLDPKLNLAGALVDLSVRMEHMHQYACLAPRAVYYNESVVKKTAADVTDGLKLRIRYGSLKERLRGVAFWFSLCKKSPIKRLSLVASLLKAVWHYRYFHRFPRECLQKPIPFYGFFYAPSLPQPSANDELLKSAPVNHAMVGIIPPEPLEEEDMSAIRTMLGNQSHASCQLVTREHVKSKPEQCDYYIFLESGYQFYPQHVERLLQLAEKRKARLSFCHAYDLKEAQEISGRSRLPLGCYLLRKDMVEKFLDAKSFESIRSKLAYIPAAETSEISLIHAA
jgi:glycosyltransferase involved in cell wall biosynthesis